MTKQDTYIYIGAAFILNHMQTILQMCERWLFFIWLIPDVSHAKITATSYGSSPLNSTGFVTLRFDCIVLGFATPATRTFQHIKDSSPAPPGLCALQHGRFCNTALVVAKC